MKINPYLIALLALITLALCIMDTEAISCMGGAGACWASCQLQNCATGRCTPAGWSPDRQTCICSRCGIGKPPYP
jgi:hypothetical protein